MTKRKTPEEEAQILRDLIRQAHEAKKDLERTMARLEHELSETTIADLQKGIKIAGQEAIEHIEQFFLPEELHRFIESVIDKHLETEWFPAICGAIDKSLSELFKLHEKNNRQRFENVLGISLPKEGR